MRTPGGILVSGAVVLLALMTGCASAVGSAPTSSPSDDASPTAAADASPSPSESVELSASGAEAQQRADTWLETTPVPPDAVRSETSTSGQFAMSYQGWVCTPTMTAKGFWTVDGMSPAEALNWMLEHPTPGLVPTRTEPVSDTDVDNMMMGATPEGESLEGIAFTYVKTSEGTAIRAEVGAVPADAVCPMPPGGGIWGRPGEG